MALHAAEYEPAERAFAQALALLEDAGERHAAARVSGQSRPRRAAHRARQAGARAPREGLCSRRRRRARCRYRRARLAARAIVRLRRRARAGGGANRARAQRVGSAPPPGDPPPRARREGDPRAGRPTPAGGARVPPTLDRVRLEQDLPDQVPRGYLNLSDACFAGDRYGEALDVLAEALALVRRIGNRRSELFALSESSYALCMTGRWDEALAAASEIPVEQLRDRRPAREPADRLVEVYINRGRLADARELVSVFGHLEGRSNFRTARSMRRARAALAYADGRHASALGHGLAAVESAGPLGMGFQSVKQGFVVGGRGRARCSASSAAPTSSSPWSTSSRRASVRPSSRLRSQRFRARMSDERGRLQGCRGRLPRVQLPVLARGDAARARRMARAHGRTAESEPLLAEAREIFERLEATPWLERAERMGGAANGSAHDLPELRDGERGRQRKFCAECGTALALACPSCGVAERAEAKFCGECGAALAAQRLGSASTGTAAPRPSAASSRSSSPTSSASRRPRRAATRRRRASFSPATSRRRGR